MPDAGSILLDANVLLYAHHRLYREHEAARAWWRQAMEERPHVGIPWPTIIAFVRISTHPRTLTQPVAVEDAWRVVQGWLTRPNVAVPRPTERHASILSDLLGSGRASGNHVPDAHLAALAIEWGLELQSCDRDFARYPGLRWRDPLVA